MLAPNSPQRARVIALARQPPAPLPNVAPASHAPARGSAHFLWAVLLARIYEIFPLRCALCGAEMRIIAFVTDAPAVNTILGHLGEPTRPPEVAP
ncbi:MAG: IS91 family transposase, partial [Burkholderiales bacterium]